MTPPSPARTGVPGRRILQAAWAGTAIFAVLAGSAAAVPGTLARPAAVVDVGLFAVGCAAFLAAFGRAVRRSTTEAVSVAGVYLLAGSAPRRVQWILLGALGAQVAIAVVTASVRLYTSLAFGILVPVFGLGLAGLWGARHGVFPPRVPPPAAHRRGRAGR